MERQEREAEKDLGKNTGRSRKDQHITLSMTPERSTGKVHRIGGGEQ